MGEDLRLRAAPLLARLYAAALHLPDVDFSAVEDAPEPKLDPALRQAVRQRFTSLPFESYWEVFHAVTPTPEDPCCGSIVDDLSDVYADVKEGLLLFDAGHVPGAVWHWRQTFGFHWGRHAVSAAKALHDFEPEDAE